MTRLPRFAPALALGLLAAAPASPSLKPGLWRLENRPHTASLDGRPLADLPYAPPPPEEVCLSAAQLADPVAWFARDSDTDCNFTKRSVAGGKVTIAGTCPAHDAGKAPGTVALSGRWAPTSYDLRFATVTHGDNGTMGFTGTMTGRRLGDCPAG